MAESNFHVFCLTVVNDTSSYTAAKIIYFKKRLIFLLGSGYLLLIHVHKNITLARVSAWFLGRMRSSLADS